MGAMGPPLGCAGAEHGRTGEEAPAMRAILYVFSGTGNTRLAADKIAAALERRGMRAAVWEARLPLEEAPDPRDYDVAGFGYPIHAFNTPRFFLRFAKGLPQVKAMPAFLFKTSGEPFHLNSASSQPLVRILRGKGFQPRMDRHLLMPYNIMFRYENSLAKQMYLHTCQMAEVIADDVVAGRDDMPRYWPWTMLAMYAFRLQWLGAWLNGPLMGAKRELCTGCGKCARECPAGNIAMEGGTPRFGWRCTMCMGCVFRCPADAIRPGFLNPWRVNGVYPFERLAGDDTVPAEFVTEDTRGYFRLFRKYYQKTGREIAAHRAARQGASQPGQEAAGPEQEGEPPRERAEA